MPEELRREIERASRSEEAEELPSDLLEKKRYLPAVRGEVLPDVRTGHIPEKREPQFPEKAPSAVPEKVVPKSPEVIPSAELPEKRPEYLPADPPPPEKPPTDDGWPEREEEPNDRGRNIMGAIGRMGVAVPFSVSSPPGGWRRLGGSLKSKGFWGKLGTGFGALLSLALLPFEKVGGWLYRASIGKAPAQVRAVFEGIRRKFEKKGKRE